ncbi:MAG: arginine deiminase-related protein [Bacteroidota bacterium]
MNEQTAFNNYYQSNTSSLNSSEIVLKALEEFDAFVLQLRQAGVEVNVFQDSESPSTPDALFPNNWMSFHANGTVALYPMFAENRRKERRMDIFDSLKKEGFEISEFIDFSSSEEDEKYMEGTGSLVLDRKNKIAYAALSERTHREIVEMVCQKLGFRPVLFTALQTVASKRLPIYHTNVMMSIGNELAMICLECIDDLYERESLKGSLIQSGKSIIELSEAQINAFAGNMQQLKSKSGKDLIVMSSQAYKSLKADQIFKIESKASIVHSPLYLIEELGGGSARCMIAENFLPKRIK